MLLQPRVLKVTNELVAVYKPPGMPFHSLNRQQQGLLAVLRSNPALLAAAAVSANQRLYAIHRLDSGTSGVILFATSREVAGQVARAFRERRVHKYYLALSARKPCKKQGSVVGDMVPGRRGAWKLLRSSVDPAVTRFVSTSLSGVRPGLRLYLVKPESGRTHQIRVAMKSIGASILGDRQYGATAAAAQEDRLYLHAAAVRVPLPGGGCLQVLDVPGSRYNSSSSSDNCSSSSSGTCGSDEGAQAAAAEGLLFQHPLVQQACQQLLPESLARDYGFWFQGSKLLSSSLLMPDECDADAGL